MNMKKSVVAVAVAACAVLGLTGCNNNVAVSSDQKAACSASGGTLIQTHFLIKKHRFGDDTTGDVSYCQTSDGKIGTVYNPVFRRDTKTGSFRAHSEEQKQFALSCMDNGGAAYTSHRQSGKVNINRVFCVKDGAYTGGL